MTKTEVELLTSAEPRRRWSAEEKRRIVAAAIEPRAAVSEVARAAGIRVSQLFQWRKQLCGPAREKPGFAVVTLRRVRGLVEHDRGRVCQRGAAADHGATDGAIVSAMIRALPIPSGVRVWLATSRGPSRRRRGRRAMREIG